LDGRGGRQGLDDAQGVREGMSARRRKRGADRRLAVLVLALAAAVAIFAASGACCISGTRPAPDFAIPRDLAGAPVIRVGLAHATAGVLRGEMPLLYPEAALRAQAIASRTYGLYEARARQGEAWDVLDDTSSQVYKGLAAESDVARKVTFDTLGVILTYR